MVSFKEDLGNIHQQVLRGFTYKTDKEQYEVNDHWVQPEDPYNVTGDCEDFAMACRELCAEAGLRTRLVYCKTEAGEGHCVLECEGYILDNRHKMIYTSSEVNYEWIAMSGYVAGDTWTTIKG